MLSANYGTAFRITTNGDLTTLVFFNRTNGATPLATLIQASDGNLYGTTTSGGAYGSGTVFRLSPDGTFSTVYTFSGTNDGVNPHAELVQAADGNFYGVTSEGGSHYSGNIFRLSLPLAPGLQKPVVIGDGITLTWSAVAGQTYQVEYCSDTFSADWIGLGSAMAATNGVMSVCDTIGPEPRRFYRVVLVP
jgi:uncharacterized repeat protein (TIGR03803 family)